MQQQNNSRTSFNFNANEGGAAAGFITSQGEDDEARQEIMAVAPKINQLSMVEQQTFS